MRKIREVLRLALWVGLSQRQIARSVQLGQGTVWEYLARARRRGVCWERAKSLSDRELDAQLFPPPSKSSSRPMPDWPEVHRELKKHKHVTLRLLWEEYRAEHPESYGYSRFCELYRAFARTLDVTLRQEYRGGEKLFVDYAGQTVAIHDRSSGEVHQAQVFVAALGASNYTYAEASMSQTLADWIGAHVRTFEALGGSPEIVVPDNLKSGVKSPCWYDPEVNPSYAELADHYGVAVIPARVQKPRDKAKVENAVLQAERWILARLRNQKFFSLRELNEEIRKLLIDLNDRPLKVLGISRRELYEQVDRPALQPLPESSYELSDWTKVRVGPDYHVEFDRHYYSVPYRLVTKQLDVRATARTVEVFDAGKRVAAHRRSRQVGKHTTLREHMPKSHQAYVDWTPKRLVNWARETGPETAAVVEKIMCSRPHPQQGFRPCLGLMRLGKKYGSERLEAACKRALVTGALSYRSVKSILDKGLDQQELQEAPVQLSIEHDNVRGAQYYAQEEEPC